MSLDKYASKTKTVDRRPFNIKEFELIQLKKDTKGILDGIIDLHIKALKKRRKVSAQPERQMNMTRGDFRAFSPLKKNRANQRIYSK